MGELEAWTRLTTVRRLCGHAPMGPSGVPDQSLVLISWAISPPPINQSSGADNLVSLVSRATLPRIRSGVMCWSNSWARAASTALSTTYHSGRAVIRGGGQRSLDLDRLPDFRKLSTMVRTVSLYPE